MRSTRLLALVLAMAVLLGGCLNSPVRTDWTQRGKGGAFSALASRLVPPELVPFSQMPYDPPDADALHALFLDAADLAADGSDPEAIEAALDAMQSAYRDFSTAAVLARIRSDADVTDAYYRAEYQRCDTLDAQLSQWLETVYQACANSPARRRLERDGCFAPHELDYYEDGGDYDDAMVALLQRESSLLARYYDLTSDPVIELDGTPVHLNDYFASDLTREEHDRAYEIYLTSINDEAAALYCELISVRRAIAAAYGYDSYEQMQYDDYGRDYTPDEAAAYCDAVAATLAPYRAELLAAGSYDQLSYPVLSERKLVEVLSQVMEGLDTAAANTFAMMREYELCNLTPSINKAATSYTTYLPSYDVPYLFVETYGDIEDIVYTAHEFGHFLAASLRTGGAACLDLEEVQSQAMELLTLEQTRDLLQPKEYDALARIKLLDMLDTFTMQAAYADFEHAVYALDETQLTPDALNDLFAEKCAAYACGNDALTRLWWTQITHLYEAPFYMVSYVVAADLAMQLYDAALTSPAAAWDAYETILHTRQNLSKTLRKANLTSPFTPDHLSQTLTIFRRELPQ